MDKEKQFIRIIHEQFRKAGQTHNNIFESDAQDLQIEGQDYLFTTDDFSEEDLFRSSDPYILGWNLATATISDILAGGGTPLFYGHSLTASKEWDEKFIELLGQGIAECLKTASVRFIGGDMGFASEWHYTGTAIGKRVCALSRRGARPGDLIYMTGTVGAGNLEAALKLYSDYPAFRPFLARVKVRFHLRMQESRLIHHYASCCIDSSDGLYRALATLCEIGNVGFRLDNIPYNNEASYACKLLFKPREVLFLGECGEYELVFTVRPEKTAQFEKKAADKKLPVFRIGEITGNPAYHIPYQGKTVDLKQLNFFARDFENIHDYLKKVEKFLDYES